MALLTALAGLVACGGSEPPVSVVLIAAEGRGCADAAAFAERIGGAAFTRVWASAHDPMAAEGTLLRGTYPGAADGDALALDAIFSGHGYRTVCLTSTAAAPAETAFDEARTGLSTAELGAEIAKCLPGRGGRPVFVFARIGADLAGPGLVESLLEAEPVPGSTVFALVGLGAQPGTPEERAAAVLIGPGATAGLRSDADRSVLELAPTLLRAARLGRHPLHGADLFELHGTGPLPEIYTFGAEATSLLVDGRWRLRVPRDGGPAALYDLEMDPTESVPLDDAARIAELSARFAY
ncbi:MAG: hypothetical protein AAF682_01955 [Planctomycetota bacterium]